MLTERDVYARLYAAIKAAGGVRAFARLHSLTPAYISDVARRRRDLSDTICATIGVVRTIVICREYHDQD